MTPVAPLSPRSRAGVDVAAADMDAVDAVIRERLRSDVVLVNQIAQYIVGAGGKRIRPRLVLLFAAALGFDGPERHTLAAVVEFIHTATLVHDDIVDEAEVRRGRLSVHSRWGNDITVLLGDYLYIKSMAMALTQDSLDVIRLLCDVTLRMIEGELYQLTKAGDVDISEEEHLEIIRRKTAYLFAGCARIGGMLGETTPAQQDALWDYGYNLGVAFQVVDDLLDYTADESALGKPVGSDLREGKVTLPIIRLLERDGSRAGALVRAIVAERTVTTTQWRELLDLLEATKGTESAYETASGFAALARQRVIDAFPPSPERDALTALVDYVVWRDR